MVVPVFIKSCQVLEKLKIGPENAQAMMTKKAIINAQALPAAFAVFVANFLKASFTFTALF